MSTSSSIDKTVSNNEDNVVVLGAMQEQIAQLQQSNVQLAQTNVQLQHQLDWFKRQLFGSKSEKRLVDNPHQLSLGEDFAAAPAVDQREKQKISYERGKGPKVRADDCVTDSGLRFDGTVPVKTIRLPVLETQGLSEDQYELIDVKKTYRLA